MIGDRKCNRDCNDRKNHRFAKAERQLTAAETAFRLPGDPKKPAKNRESVEAVAGRDVRARRPLDGDDRFGEFRPIPGALPAEPNVSTVDRGRGFKGKKLIE